MNARRSPERPRRGAPLPRLIAWEVTRSCLLQLQALPRVARQRSDYAGELTLAECRALLDNIASFSRPTIILTGGEPMLRADIYDIAGYAHGLGLPVVMAPCGPLLNDETVAKILQSGIRRISLSLDGATAASHDEFRGIPGAFESVPARDRGGPARRAGVPDQHDREPAQPGRIARDPRPGDPAARGGLQSVPARADRPRERAARPGTFVRAVRGGAPVARRAGETPGKSRSASPARRTISGSSGRCTDAGSAGSGTRPAALGTLRAALASRRRLPGRQGVRLHLASRESPNLRVPGPRGRRPAAREFRFREDLEHVPALRGGARRGLLPRPLRRLRIPESSAADAARARTRSRATTSPRSRSARTSRTP